MDRLHVRDHMCVFYWKNSYASIACGACKYRMWGQYILIQYNFGSVCRWDLSSAHLADNR